MNNLKKILQQQGVTQSELARQLNISRQRVNNWTRNINYPDIKHIKLVSIYLKVPIDKLFFNGDK